MSKNKMPRRSLIKTSLAAMGAIGLSSLAAKAAGGTCSLSPQQPEGPFYPIKNQDDKNWDLTQVNGREKIALGEIVLLKGVVLNELCQPVSGALVEIWQACASGKYNHPGDPNPAILDPDFQYWGQALSNEKGEYTLKTIKPGAYLANQNWMRPPHIHIKVHLRGFHELTTQIYFAEENLLNKEDLILKQLDPGQQESVTIKFSADQENSSDIRAGVFNINMKKI